ncbi:MAG: SCO1664 family protein [Chloroflexota bacterium]|nr:SCO1664 family protein [Chloroflexota bacterium]
MRSRSRIIRVRQAAPRSERTGRPLTREQTWQVLCEGDIEMGSLVPWGSNYTYYVTLRYGELEQLAVYKPRRGEAPLIDFPSGTLYMREYAAYLTSDWLGWGLVPTTVVRQDGPYGPGSVQQYVEAEGPPHVYALGPEEADELKRLVVFDLLVNNADRKPAHCFKGPNHKVWAIDHGLTFHARPKLRTVIWDFCGEQIPEFVMRDLESARYDEGRVQALNRQLKPLLAPHEIDAFWRRYDAVLAKRTYPQLDPRYNVPYGFA